MSTNSARTAPRVSHSIFRMLVRAQIAGKLKLCPYATQPRRLFRHALQTGARTPTFGNVDSQLAAWGFLVFGLHIGTRMVHCLDHLVERDTVRAVATESQRHRIDGLYRAEGVASRSAFSEAWPFRFRQATRKGHPTRATEMASGCCVSIYRKRPAAFISPVACEDKGPMPILNIS